MKHLGPEHGLDLLRGSKLRYRLHRVLNERHRAGVVAEVHAPKVAHAVCTEGVQPAGERWNDIENSLLETCS